MLSFLVFTFIATTQSQSICLWASSQAPALNGEYVYAGTYGVNSLPYYEKTVLDTSCAVNSETKQYLWNYNDDWVITGVLGDNTLYGRCAIGSANTDPITACANEWSFYNNIDVQDSTNDTPDASLMVSSGSCPEWLCDKITSTFDSSNQATNPCGADPNGFDTKIGVNAWQGYSTLFDQDVFFYFHAQYGYYVCNNELNYGCSLTMWDWSDSGWRALSEGSNTAMTFENGASITINCVDSGTVTDPTASPVPSPTASPVNPTTSPVNPTASPVNPTTSPVDAGTPTRSPISPTTSPVNPGDPTKSPVIAPTSSPINPGDPTSSPVDDAGTPTMAPIDGSGNSCNTLNCFIGFLVITLLYVTIN